ncbi:MAG: DUF924 domain-containing protein [Gammaproteobacteria bacterium]|nr:DUF924 domain-containing protein [Gammaproteobacteria bacterium]
MSHESSAVLDFWFEELQAADHFKKNTHVDRQIRERFLTTHAAASRGELSEWRETGEGRLAEIIVLDQFSRNLYRDDARAYACDGMALVLAQEAVRAGANETLPPGRCAFLYMPFMHSESLRIHDVAMELFAPPGLGNNLKFERRHRLVIERFGRYPARNAALGRNSTAEEVTFLKDNPSGF